MPIETGLAIGDPAPTITLDDGRGGQIDLDRFRGRPVLLVFYRGGW